MTTGPGSSGSSGSSGLDHDAARRADFARARRVAHVAHRMRREFVRTQGIGAVNGKRLAEIDIGMASRMICSRATPESVLERFVRTARPDAAGSSGRGLELDMVHALAAQEREQDPYVQRVYMMVLLGILKGQAGIEHASFALSTIRALRQLAKEAPK